VIEALLVSFGLVFVAELGDKSQLLTLAFSARYRAVAVLTGLVLATATLMALSVTVGAVVGDVLPERAVKIVAGLLFLGFAAWTLRGDEDDDEVEARSGRSAVWATFVAFALAEFGDKTMLATITLAADRPALAVWAGATAGMVSANALALVVGDRLGRWLPERTVRTLAAAAFAVVGILLLVSATIG
jgi:Ca2+/H+ antiporter, TMEM165/GDT1 family